MLTSYDLSKAKIVLRTRSLFLLLLLLLGIVTIAAVLLGATQYSPTQLLTDSQAQLVIFELRLPRVLFALLVGGGLSVIGAAYQALFRNQLASPFSLGVSSGAALGASLSLLCGGGALFDVEACAIFGAAISIFLIMLLSKTVVGAARDSLLLIGVVFSFFCSSLLTLIQYLSDYSQLFRVTRWMMGGVPVLSWSALGIGAILIGVVVIWLFKHHRELDLMLFGDDIAAIKGVDGPRLSRNAFILTSVVVGWIVAQCGVIGFVGIVVPAAVRLLVGLHHRRVIPVAFVSGALLVVLCDLLGRVVTPPFEVPAGVFTAVLGGPVFVLLLIRGNRRVL